MAIFNNPCSYRKILLGIPAVLVVISILSMIFVGFNLGIDFKSGTTFEIEHMPEGFKVDKNMEAEVKALVTSVRNSSDARTQSIGEDGVFITVTELTNEEAGKVADLLVEYFNGKTVAEITASDVTASSEVPSVAVTTEDATDVLTEEATAAANEGNAEVSNAGEVEFNLASINQDTVRPSTAKKLVADTIKAVAIAIALMLLYIGFRFDFKSGVCAVLALSHDVILMFGFYSVFQCTMNTSFVAAVLTIIGYSINATIIVFDRVRENNKMMLKATTEERADKAIKTSYTRTLFSSLTTLFTIGALYVLGVSSIREFALPIIVGIVCGAYSSLFVAPTVWSLWKKSEKK